MREVFLLDYTVSAAVLALWLHVRWPLTPSLKLYGAHLAVAILALNVIGAVPAAAVLVVTLTFLALVYAFLVAAWGIEIVKQAQGMGR